METPTPAPNGDSSAEPKQPLSCTTTGLSGQTTAEITQREFGMTPLHTRTPDSDFTPFASPQRGVTFRSIDEEARTTEGYPKLAEYMGKDLPIYRRFATTNARLLLYRQSEITYLEHELSDLEQRYKANPRLHQSVRDLINSPPGSDGHHLWQKIQQLNDAVERYNRLLLDQKKLYEIRAPEAEEVNEIWNFINAPSEGVETEPWLQPPENSAYIVHDKTRQNLQQDLVKLKVRFREADPFTKWFTGPFLRWVYENFIVRLSPKAARDGWDADINTLERSISVITIMIASLLPAVSIIALYYIKAATYRLVFILLFSAVFSAAMSLFTNADRAGIFSASLALAGVQAVFVGSMIGSSGACGSGGCN